ncbi:ABC transporter ATP-binding protein [Paenibacillus protaetiae]|uniref:Carnitine transport ATP-binding protein OpuCA n=1 Tax=Paenibacillus protaetiae TaxID=2509456 RepID=A0A4P6EZ59_9BACL|nr:ABC transporter ATP-binding protein [Paenibacillus protaetiae]QAY67563.1 ABC transporter ATP-binding protein [Paenibacillus protaetiae]
MNIAEPHIRITNVSKSFGSFAALHGISLDIPSGSFTTLLGPSGCGKTTLLRLIAGFDEPDSGDIWIEGAKVNGLPPFRRNTPLVFQEYALFPHMTVFDNIAYGLKLQKKPREAVRQKVDEMLGMFGLAGMEGRLPQQLSGGQQQRVAFARALATGHRVLLMDEPLSNLDAKMRVEVRSELRELQRRAGITAVFVTHDQDEALSLSDHIAVFDKGRIRQAGTPLDVYFKPRDRFVADFVGTANFIPGVVVAAEAQELIVRSEISVFRVNRDDAGSFRSGDAITMVIRPECISISAETEGADGLIGDIISSSFLGRMIRYRVQCGSLTFIVDDANPGAGGALSGTVSLHPDPGKIHVLPEERKL